MIRYKERVRQLEGEGCTSSEACDVADAEAYEGLLACDCCGEREAGSDGIADEFGITNCCAPCFANKLSLTPEL